MTVLGKKQAAGVGSPSAPAASPSKLSRFACRGEEVQLPLLGPARIEILGARDGQEVEGAVIARMEELGIERTYVTADRYELERATRTLALAVRDPDDRSKPYGTLEEWYALDSDVIGAAWQVYGDVRERLDPVAASLSEDERVQIEAAFKKKDGRLLRSFGIGKLSAWLVSLDAPPSISPSPSSPTPPSPSAP